MKTQLDSFIRWLLAVVYSFLSNPRQVRLVVTVIVICLVLAALLVPTLVTFADHQGGG